VERPKVDRSGERPKVDRSVERPIGMTDLRSERVIGVFDLGANDLKGCRVKVWADSVVNDS
jgi:hypothetical protein